jgi:hypothetical protein
MIVTEQRKFLLKTKTFENREKWVKELRSLSELEKENKLILRAQQAIDKNIKELENKNKDNKNNENINKDKDNKVNEILIKNNEKESIININKNNNENINNEENENNTDKNPLISNLKRKESHERRKRISEVIEYKN